MNAIIPGVSSPVDVVVENGIVIEVAQRGSRSVLESSSFPPVEEIDLGGKLLLPSLRENHAHLDKALTADSIVNRSGDLMGAIRAWIEAEDTDQIGFEDMVRRVESAAIRLLHSGVTHVRTHVNVGGSDPGLRNLRAVDTIRRKLSGIIEFEVVALLHSPLTGEMGRENRRALDAAIEFGVDLIGGCPHLEIDPDGMLDIVLDRAGRESLGLDLHVDETLDPQMLTLLSLARKVAHREIDYSVTASHCVSLSVQELDVQFEVAEALRQAAIRVVALPQTNLYLQGWDRTVAMPRGIAPLGLLAEQGVEIAAGGDNIEDPFNPMGRSDPLETASLLVTASHLDPRIAFDAVSTRPLWHSIDDIVGSHANFLAVEATNVREAIARAPAQRTTIRNGRVVASTEVVERLHGFLR